MECFVTLFNGVQGLTFSVLDLHVAVVVAAAVDEVEVDSWKGLRIAFLGV